MHNITVIEKEHAHTYAEKSGTMTRELFHSDYLSQAGCKRIKFSASKTHQTVSYSIIHLEQKADCRNEIFHELLNYMSLTGKSNLKDLKMSWELAQRDYSDSKPW